MNPAGFAALVVPDHKKTARGGGMADIRVGSVMSRDVRSCRPTDSVELACRILRTNQLHRLPVLDGGDNLVGMLSLTDVAREAALEQRASRPGTMGHTVAETAEAISRRRLSGALRVI